MNIVFLLKTGRDTVSAMFDSGLVKRTVVYAFSGALNALVAFLLLPVLTRYLSPFDYGIVETFLAVTALLTGVILIGGTTILSKEYFRFKGEELARFVGNIQGIIFISTVVMLMLLSAGLLFSDFAASVLKLSRPILMLAVFVSFAGANIALFTTLLQLEKKSKVYSLFMNSKTITEILVSLLFVVLLGMKWDGRIWAVVLTNLFFLGIVYYSFKIRRIKMLLQKNENATILKLGVPLAVAHISVWVYGMVDKLMINNLVDVSSTGLYSVGFRFGMVVNMLETSFSIAWAPYFFENINRGTEEANLRIVRATYVYAVLLVLFSVGFGLCGKYLLYLMVDEKFYGAGKFVFLISSAYCVGGIWKMFSGYLIFKGKTKVYSYITCATAVVHVGLSYLLLSNFGLIGSAWAMFFSMLLGAVLTVVAGVVSYPMPWLSFRKLRAI